MRALGLVAVVMGGVLLGAVSLVCAGPFPGDGVEGPALSYQDNLDGTTRDLNTNLLWEQKLPVDDLRCTAADQAQRSVHCVNNVYTWSATAGGTEPDGTAYTVFLRTLNNMCSLDETISCELAAGKKLCRSMGGQCGFAG
jgi:hypothetical protein